MGCAIERDRLGGDDEQPIADQIEDRVDRLGLELLDGLVEEEVDAKINIVVLDVGGGEIGVSVRLGGPVDEDREHVFGAVVGAAVGDVGERGRIGPLEVVLVGSFAAVEVEAAGAEPGHRDHVVAVAAGHSDASRRRSRQRHPK